jgi:YidC/Oxa1 family membrane protein insertase
MQQQIMKYMMVFIGFMFFRVPSGLCVYFITSSLWGIAERKLLPHGNAAKSLPPAKDDEKSHQPPKSGGDKSGGSNSGGNKPSGNKPGGNKPGGNGAPKGGKKKSRRR